MALTAHPVHERTDSRNGYFHDVTGLDWRHAGGRSAGNDVARLERHAARKMRDEVVGTENEISRRVILHDVAVDACLDAQRRGVHVVGDTGAENSEAVESLRARELREGLVAPDQIARRDIVDAR